MTIKSNLGNNPRLNLQSVWVGVDIQLPVENKVFSTVKDYVAHFCETHLDCHYENIVWAVVTKSTINGLVRYQLGDNDAALIYNDNGLLADINSGFIYTSVDDALNTYVVRELDGSILGDIDCGFTQDLEHYSAWCNNSLSEYKKFVSLGISPIGNEYLNSGIAIDRNLALDIIGQFGGWDNFIALYPLVNADGIDITYLFLGEEVLYEMYQRNKVAVIEFFERDSILLEYGSMFEMIGAYNKIKGVYSEVDVVLAFYDERFQAKKIIIREAMAAIAQSFCFYYNSFLKDKNYDRA